MFAILLYRALFSDSPCPSFLPEPALLASERDLTHPSSLSRPSMGTCSSGKPSLRLPPGPLPTLPVENCLGSGTSGPGSVLHLWRALCSAVAGALSARVHGRPALCKPSRQMPGQGEGDHPWALLVRSLSKLCLTCHCPQGLPDPLEREGAQ